MTTQPKPRPPFERLPDADIVSLLDAALATGLGEWQATNDLQTAHGDNWWMATTGTGADGKEWYVCTKNVPASEGMATAEAVAKFTAEAHNRLPRLIAYLTQAYGYITYLEEEDRKKNEALDYALNALDDVYAERDTPLMAKVHVHAILRGQTHQEGR